MANFVQIYKSTDANAPVLTGQVSKLVDLLDAVLVNGYTTASVASITRSGSTVTVTLSAANSTLVTGDYVKLSGAVETDYNGVWQITVTSSTTFTFNIGVLTPTSPATGTILYRKAPLNWTKPYTGTNAAVFRSQNTGSPRHYLQVIDNGATVGGAKESQVMAFETMSAYNTGTGPFPTVAQQANGLCWFKSSTADATARDWTIIGDDKGFYLQINSNATAATTNLYGFGWFPSYKAGDAYNTFIAGSPTFNLATPLYAGLNYLSAFTTTNGAPSATDGIYLARSFSQTGGSISVPILPGFGNPSTPGYGIGASYGVAYPDLVASGVIVAPVFISESITGTPIRGRLPGFYSPFHNVAFSNYDDLSGISGLAGLTLTVLTLSTSNNVGQASIDRIGPWA